MTKHNKSSKNRLIINKITQAEFVEDGDRMEAKVLAQLKSMAFN